jgi:hypothetical protein
MGDFSSLIDVSAYIARYGVIKYMTTEVFSSDLCAFVTLATQVCTTAVWGLYRELFYFVYRSPVSSYTNTGMVKVKTKLSLSLTS